MEVAAEACCSLLPARKSIGMPWMAISGSTISRTGAPSVAATITAISMKSLMRFIFSNDSLVVLTA